jgi:BirA family biotin operon repressor/biotin-[acetyl-CoA-carboxylase] ligase
LPPRTDLLPGEIRRRLRTRGFGRRVYYLTEVDSTNRLAAELARSGEPHGSIVVADHQTSGKGRRDRRWESPPGRNLLFSLILRPEGSARDVLPATLAFGLSIARALSRILVMETGVKWPNDVEIGGRKIAGMLSESSTRGERTAFLVVGSGVNVNARAEEFGAEYRDRACSCYTLTGREWDRAAMLAAVLLEMEESYDGFVRGGFSSILESYKKSMGILGKRIRFERRGEPATGVASDVAPDGGLVVETQDGTTTLYEEEIGIVREERG